MKVWKWSLLGGDSLVEVPLPVEKPELCKCCMKPGPYYVQDHEEGAYIYRYGRRYDVVREEWVRRIICHGEHPDKDTAERVAAALNEQAAKGPAKWD